MTGPTTSPAVAVIGGGFSGAALAIHLRRRYGGRSPLRIVVFEPRERLGLGLAYGTREPAHRINVPAGKMTLYPDRPESFLEFVERHGIAAKDPDCIGRDGLPYPRRSDFGAYVAQEAEPYLASGEIEHRWTAVVSVERAGSRWRVIGDDGSTTVADVVALAVSHPSPALPGALSRLAGHPKLIGDVTAPDALDGIGVEDRVLILGNGLTSADVVASLAEKGHRGPILSISRRGLRSRGHPKAPQDPYGDFASPPSVRASDLLRRIRAALKEAAGQGLSWHAVLDAVRAQGQSIWQALPVEERRRIARLARPYWDVHRFRIAPQVEDVLDEAVAAGRLSIKAASLLKASAVDDGFDVALRERGRVEEVRTVVDAIVVTTGPAHGGILISQPFLRKLQAEGLLTACRTGLGIACDLRAVATGGNSQPVEGLYIVGPLARGTFGELMGLPQVTEHAVFVADRIAERLGLEEAKPGMLEAG
ncbi:FAD/NAD(P)-binding protein [Pseudomonas sp. R2.Fl]|nr:FAD/NAD(P)-binding protein [Pseudomonas sp. R2.Fl]